MSSTTGQIIRPESSKMRWLICALLFWVTTANYIDRSVFGNLKPEMPKYLHLADRVTEAQIDQYLAEHGSEVATQLTAPAPADTKVAPTAREIARQKITQKQWDADYWNIQMVFSLAYAVSTMLMGRLMDVFGLRWGFACACAFWALASLSQSFAPEIGNTLFGNPIYGFFLCTAMLSLGQGANFPGAIKTTAEWFPKRERALATGLFNSGSNLGGLLAPWLLPMLLTTLATVTFFGRTVGWRGAFLPGIILDVTWIIAWLAIYRKPAEHPRVSQKELDIIMSDGKEPVTKVPWRVLLRFKQTWAFSACKFLTDGFWWFYLFGAADFFYRKFNLAPNDRKWMIMVIYIVASVGSISGGWLAGKFMSMGWSVNKARKITMLICALAVVPVFFASLTGSLIVATVLITLAASAHQAWSANAMSLVGDMFPRRVVGSVTGFAIMLSSLGSMLVLKATGLIVSSTGSYLLVFIMAGVAYPLGLLIIHLAVPRLEQAKID